MYLTRNILNIDNCITFINYNYVLVIEWKFIGILLGIGPLLAYTSYRIRIKDSL